MTSPCDMAAGLYRALVEVTEDRDYDVCASCDILVEVAARVCPGCGTVPEWVSRAVAPKLCCKCGGPIPSPHLAASEDERCAQCGDYDEATDGDLIYASVVASMQAADDDDTLTYAGYVALMHRIAAEAIRRAQVAVQGSGWPQ